MTGSALDNLDPELRADLFDAIADLWLDPKLGSSFTKHPPFKRLRDACFLIYPESERGRSLGFSLLNAIRALGLPPENSPKTLDQEQVAQIAADLSRAFRRTTSTRLHLCPLDECSELPDLAFGPNRIRTYSTSELRQLVDADRLTRIVPSWIFEGERFAQLTWLVVGKELSITEPPEARAMPFMYRTFDRDYATIQPHRRKFPESVETAIFALLLAPWEDWVAYSKVDWRAFKVPWAYTIDDDIFIGRIRPPSADTLSWEPGFQPDGQGDLIEYEKPMHLPMNGDVAADDWINSAGWAAVQHAMTSSLFDGPVIHFFVRAFLSEGIDEFLAHITTIEAALGSSGDGDRQQQVRLVGQRGKGATARVSARLSRLLDDEAAGSVYTSLFKKRSDFVHGRPMSDISGNDRLSARRLARRAVVALVENSGSLSAGATREAFLESILPKA